MEYILILIHDLLLDLLDRLALTRFVENVELLYERNTLKVFFRGDITLIVRHTGDSYAVVIHGVDCEEMVKWDNAPHHRDLSSFPHHVHEGGLVKESSKRFTVDTLAEDLLQVLMRLREYVLKST